MLIRIPQHLTNVSSHCTLVNYKLVSQFICKFVAQCFVFMSIYIHIYIHTYIYTHTHFYCCFSVAKSCLTLCDSMYCSMPGSCLPHCLPEFAQIQVHGVMMLFHYLILCLPILLLPSTFPNSVQFSHSVVSDSLQLHGLQHIRLPCPLPELAQTHVH